MDRPDFQETDVHRGLDSTLTIFAPRFKKTLVKVERRYAPKLPLVCGHPGELNQVWTNLIDNALDAMDGKGTLTIATWPEEDGVSVEVGDTGPGIPPAVKDRIFEPFFTTKAVGEGTGMGLDIVYRIVRMRHGGSIRVTSSPGDTRFQVRLPIQPPKEA
jgi:signal transduction histidine kinase